MRLTRALNAFCVTDNVGTANWPESNRTFRGTVLPREYQYFYREGKVVHQLSGIRGEVLAVFSVADGAVLEPNFGGRPYSQARRRCPAYHVPLDLSRALMRGGRMRRSSSAMRMT